nr:hypothetical protein JVH1_6539 [Rhodococcus sp. JVH1]
MWCDRIWNAGSGCVEDGHRDRFRPLHFAGKWLIRLCRRHRDRLARFGFGLIEAVLSVPCRTVLVLTDDGW